MAREKELFRDNLVVLREQFGETDLIPLKKVSDYIKVGDRTLKTDKNFPVKKIGRMYYVPIVGLASWLS